MPSTYDYNLGSNKGKSTVIVSYSASSTLHLLHNVVTAYGC